MTQIIGYPETNINRAHHLCCLWILQQSHKRKRNHDEKDRNRNKEARHGWSMLITATLINFVGSFTVAGCRKWSFNRGLCLWISSLQFSLPASCLSTNWRDLYLFTRSCDGANISSPARLASPTSCWISYAPEILYSNTKWISSPFSQLPTNQT